MDFRDIETFIELEHLRNFSRTAEKLFISQTTVSARIKNLECELKVPLFIRTTHTVELTPAGYQFLPYAKNFCRTLKRVQRDLIFSSRFDHFVSIAAPESVWTEALVSALGQCIDAHNEICFKMFCAHSSSIIPKILDHTIDIAFVLRQPTHTDIEVVPFHTNSFYLVGHPDLALPAEQLTSKNIFSFPLIHMFWGQTFQEWFKAYYPPNAHRMEVDQTSVLTKFLLARKGVAFLPERQAREYLKTKQLVTIPFDHQERMPVEQSYMIYLKNNNSLLAPLIEEIQSELVCTPSVD